MTILCVHFCAYYFAVDTRYSLFCLFKQNFFIVCYSLIRLYGYCSATLVLAVRMKFSLNKRVQTAFPKVEKHCIIVKEVYSEV